MRRLIICIFIFWFFSGLFVKSYCDEEQDQIQIAEWIGKHYRDVADAVLPTPTIDPRRVWSDASWFVVVRGLPTFKPEFAFSIVRKNDGELEITYSALVPSLRKQIRDLLTQNPEANWQEISSQVKITRCTIAPAQMPKFRKLAEDLENMKLSVLVVNPSPIDATGYEIQTFIEGRRFEIQTGDSPYEEYKPPDALIAFLRKARKLFQENMSMAKCIVE